MPCYPGVLWAVIAVLVLWVAALLRENFRGAAGCTEFHLHQLTSERAAVGAPAAPAARAPAAAAGGTTSAQFLHSTAPPAESVPAAVKRLAYARFPKTGSRYAIEKFQRVIGKDLFVIPEAKAVRIQNLKEAFVVGSVRNPCESYLSLWAFQSDPNRRAGLMYDLKRRQPEDYSRLVGRNPENNFTGPEDVQRFRDWIRFLSHSSVDLGLMSGRFHGKYLSTSQGNMRDNALLVKDLTPPKAMEVRESLDAMNVDTLADCWLHTETMDKDLTRCLALYQQRGGRVDLQHLSVSQVKGSSHHGSCAHFFDEATEDLVRKLDAPLFSKFGYDSCCQRKDAPITPREEPLHPVTRNGDPSDAGGARQDLGHLGPWAWGDPFEVAFGRPEQRHSGSFRWKAHVGPCDVEVDGPSERKLQTANMLTLPPLRMALDEAILACLRSADLPKDRPNAQLMMYQCVLSGLFRSCDFLAKQGVDFSATEAFSVDAIDNIQRDWSRNNAWISPKALSIFKLTGFGPRKWTHSAGRNLVQLAVWMGHADLIRALVGSNLSWVVDPVSDAKQRTLRDYLSAPGSPVYNWQMADAVAGAVANSRYRVERPKPTGLLHCDGTDYPELSLGWTQETTWDHYRACDFEVVDSLNQKDFEENYRNLGRPVLIRNFAHIEDRCNMRKAFVMENHGHESFDLGPIAYPNLIGTQPCEKKFTLEEAERGAHCERHGNTSNYRATHSPDLVPHDLKLMKTFAKVKEILPRINHLSKQYFWGGDRSGAALHYHVAAFNALFVGEKEWYVTPPYLAARSGIATDALFHREGINHEHLFRCTQYAGDLVLIPDGWGHATLNHGFGMGIGVLYDEVAE